MTPPFTHTRRTLLKGAAATGLFLAAPITLRAQPTIVRQSLATSDSATDVNTYREAVKFMLTKAEPNDPDMFHLNWYRNAMIHLLDCPHGNWWFAVWHRPYLAYLEQKIRDITGNVEFALPFWDWTVQREIPKAFMSDPSSADPDIRDNPLDPSSSYFMNANHQQPLNDAVNAASAAYSDALNALRKAQDSGNQAAITAAQAAVNAAIQAYNVANEALLDHTFPQFDAKYRSSFEALWNTFNPAQLAQLQTRFGAAPGKTDVDFEWFWTGSGNSVRGNFIWDDETARFLKIGNPQLTGRARAAVSENNIESSVRSKNFALSSDEVGGEDPSFGFNTIEGDTHHSMSRTQAILEGQPHNLVHNATGAVMQSNLSSVDPIFFMHHSNVDRIWDVWTRRQMSLTPPRPHLPEHNAAKFDAEEFLFYIMPDGMPVTKDTNAATFMDKARYGYSYAPGTGENQITTPALIASAATARVSASVNATPGAIASFSQFASLPLDEEVTPTLDKSAAAPNILAEITTTLPDIIAGLTIEVFVSAKGETPDTSEDSPALAGAIGFFGMNALDTGMQQHNHAETAVFDVDVTEAIDRLTAEGALEPGADIDVSIHPVRTFGTLRSDATGQAVLQSVRLKTI